MATGMVLVIVSRNIDLSVGSVLGFIGYTMAMAPDPWIPLTLGLGLEQPYTWIVSVIIGVVLGAIIGGLQGFVIAYGGIPSFIVTLGGLLVWRGLIFSYAQGQTLGADRPTFRCSVGDRRARSASGRAGSSASSACVAIVSACSYSSTPAPVWVPDAAVVGRRPLGVVGCAVVLWRGRVANDYPWPKALASAVRRRERHRGAGRAGSSSRPGSPSRAHHDRRGRSS